MCLFSLFCTCPLHHCLLRFHLPFLFLDCRRHSWTVFDVSCLGTNVVVWTGVDATATALHRRGFSHGNEKWVMSTANQTQYWTLSSSSLLLLLLLLLRFVYPGATSFPLPAGLQDRATVQAAEAFVSLSYGDASTLRFYFFLLLISLSIWLLWSANEAVLSGHFVIHQTKAWQWK